MAILEIKTYGATVLREKAAPVTEVGPEEEQLIEDMVETMYAAPGIGLAANQVGVSKQIAVVDVNCDESRESLLVLINPEILHQEGKTVDQEGCLSLPEVFENIERPSQIRITALDRKGQPFELEAEGLLARAICHEVDHLKGTLILDWMSSLKRNLIKKKIRKRQESDDA